MLSVIIQIQSERPQGIHYANYISAPSVSIARMQGVCQQQHRARYQFRKMRVV
jgi:hypothetical protein